jgi:hypothetical protein
VSAIVAHWFIRVPLNLLASPLEAYEQMYKLFVIYPNAVMLVTSLVDICV